MYGCNLALYQRSAERAIIQHRIATFRDGSDFTLCVQTIFEKGYSASQQFQSYITGISYAGFCWEQRHNNVHHMDSAKQTVASFHYCCVALGSLQREGETSFGLSVALKCEARDCRSNYRNYCESESKISTGY